MASQLADSMTKLSIEDKEVKSPLFLESSSDTAIIVWDVSGSTGSTWDARGRRYYSVFDEMAKVVKALGHKQYRFVFWNSPGANNGRLQRGVMVLPFVVRVDTLDAAIASGRAVIGGGTCPPIGFQAIPPEWFKGDPMVYFVTDGQIGCGEMNDTETKRRLAECIRALPAQLTIIAVENQNRDFSKVENVQQAAGGDVYALIQNERLSNKVARFVSYALNGSTVQIDKVKAPAGHAPYGNKYFSMLRTAEFIAAVRAELDADKSEAAQMVVAQKLSATLEALTRDKPPRMADDIIRTFAGMFTVDQNMVRWIITDGIERERGGQAAVMAHFRGQLKNLFAQADGLLKQDVCGAVGMNDGFVSGVCNGRVLTGSYRLVDKTVRIAGVGYPRSGVTDFLPVFPKLAEGARLTDLQDQCLRQWIRQVYASVHRVHPTVDEIIYLVLGDMLKVVSGGASDPVKTAYRQLARCILRKKRLNSMQTEMDRLLAGELPVPNSGKIEDFYTYMGAVNLKLGIQGTPLRVWYAMCQALDPVLAAKQERHCAAELGSALVVPVVNDDAMPDSSSFDYTCLVTLDDISAVGGWRILPHVGGAGPCAPVYLLSDAGRASMLASNNCVCPLCYKALEPGSFVREGPKIAFDMPDGYRTYADRYAAPPVEQKVAAGGGGPIRNANGKTGKLVILKGPVGCGKSTTAAEIKTAVEARGGVCLVEGVDKYAKDGTPIAQAVGMVENALRHGVTDCKNDDLVVVIDTCGEQTQPRQMKAFNVDFHGWTRIDVWPNLDRANLPGFFAWSLRNVLQRRIPGPADSHWLNPVGASVQVCIDVHKKKCKALFGNDFQRAWQFAGATVQNLGALADEYAKTVRPFSMPPLV